MADQIQTPNGLEAAETLADDNVMEVYQADAGGERGNKQESLDTLRDFFQTLESYITGNLIKSGASGVPSDTGYNADTLYNKVNTDHEDRIGDNETNIDTNSDNIVTANANIATNVVDIATLEGKVGQSLNTDDDVEFANVTTSGVAITTATSTISLTTSWKDTGIDVPDNSTIIPIFNPSDGGGAGSPETITSSSDVNITTGDNTLAIWYGGSGTTLTYIYYRVEPDTSNLQMKGSASLTAARAKTTFLFFSIA